MRFETGAGIGLADSDFEQHEQTEVEPNGEPQVELVETPNVDGDDKLADMTRHKPGIIRTDHIAMCSPWVKHGHANALD